MPQLELDVTTDAAAAAAGLDDVGAAARNMASDVSTAASSADTAVGSMDGLAAGADAVDSKMGAATGSLGALAGGLEAAGFEGAAAGLQGVAAATDFASGAGGILNLVMDTQAAKFVVAKAAAIGSAIATGAQTTATGIATGAQWALNAALSANPLGLVIALVLAVAAALIIAYQKSETFRDIVDTAMGVVKDAVGSVSGAVETAVGWVKKLPDGWDAIKTAASDALTPVTSAVGAVSDALQTAVGWVQSLIDWISKIDFPDINLPGNPFNGRGFAGEGVDPDDPRLQRAAPLVVGLNLTVAPQDKDAATRALVDGLREYFERRGQTLQITGS